MRWKRNKRIMYLIDERDIGMNNINENGIGRVQSSVQRIQRESHRSRVQSWSVFDG